MTQRYMLLMTMLLALLPNLSNSAEVAARERIITHKVEGVYSDVAGEVRAAIEGKGINIAHVLQASDMLHRTAAAFGYNDDVYLNAETYEFCSARISHKLSRIDPDNIVLCPFTISVYVVRDDPAHVRLSYRVPVGKPGTEDAAREVEQLIESILNDATW